MTEGHIDGAAKATWKPGPKLPTPDDIARSFHYSTVVTRAAGLAEADPQVYANFLNRRPPKALEPVRRTLGLKGGGKIDRRSTKLLLGRLAAPGSQERVLDAVCRGDTFFGYILTDRQWLSLLRSDAEGLLDVTGSGLDTLRAIHGAVSGPTEDPAVLVDLADGIRRGPNGAAVALALMAEVDERAATAYAEVAQAFSAIPAEPPTWAQLRHALGEVLGIEEPELEVDGLSAEGAVDEGDADAEEGEAATPDTDQPIVNDPSEGEGLKNTVPRAIADSEDARRAVGSFAVEELEQIVGEQWEAASIVAGELHRSLEAGIVQASAVSTAGRLRQFVARVAEVAAALDATTRDELRDALAALRQKNTDPARRWLLRLAAMQGPADLAESVRTIAALAEEAAQLSKHERDEALVSLLTLIDLAAERAAGGTPDWQAANEHQVKALNGLPKHGGLVFAAGVGKLTVPSLDEIGGDASWLDANPEKVDGGVPAEPFSSDSDDSIGSYEDDTQSGDVEEVAAAESRTDDHGPGIAEAASASGVAESADEQPPERSVETESEPKGDLAPKQPQCEAAAVPDGSVNYQTGQPAQQSSAHAAEITPTSPTEQGTERQRVEGDSDPWAEGEPSKVAALISSHRLGLAYYLAKAAGKSEAQVRALAFFAGANQCRSDRVVGELGPVWPDPDQIAQLNANECRILLAAETRMALSLGYDPTGLLESFLSNVSLEDYPAAEPLSTIVRMAAHGFQRPAKVAAFDSTPDQWRNILTTAEEVHSNLVNSKINYQRASRIIHYLARDNEPIGEHLVRIKRIAEAYSAGNSPAPELWQHFSVFANALQDPDEQTRLLDEADRAVSVPSQIRKPVIANAKTRMYALLASVADLSAEVTALRSRTENVATGKRSGGDVSGFLAARDALVPVTVKSVGDAALQSLIAWLRDEEPAPTTGSTLAEVLERDIDPLYELPRDESGRPTRDPSAAEVESLAEGRDPLVVVRGYLEVGNRRAAEDYIVRARVPRTDELTDELRESAHDLKKRHKSVFGEAARTVSRVRALNEDLEEDDSALSFAGRLSALETIATDERGDLTLRAIQEVQDDAAAVLAKVRDALRSRAQNVMDEDDRLRILGLIDGGEEPLAVEYLTLSDAGAALPMLETVIAEDFARFFPEVVGVADEARKSRRDSITAVRDELDLQGEPEQQRLRLGLAGWRAVAREKQGAKTFRENVADIVRMLGLNPEPSVWLTPINKTKNAGYASFALRARPADGSYVPLFGTKAGGRYDLTLVWEEVRNPRALLQKIDVDHQSEPNIILYFGTLSIDQRIQLRKLTHSAEFSPLVIDEAVIGWLSTREEPGWKLTQRVALPFTTVNPYVSVGDVPDEVFVGRERERRAIIDPTGSMFVYGGRQLGKSALLRRVERGLNRDSDRTTVVYLDLKTANLGEAAPASELWPELGSRLDKVGVLEGRRSKWTADEVIHGVERWLGVDGSRRLLLLLDEADNFLTYDASDTGRTGLGGFPVLQRLKGLMESSQGRFKPVFAGLHQVQRFHDMPNTPVAHGGDDILIGPLNFGDAQRLVADPLRALGFEFESPETVWRLLLLTNYQASLIQIVCEALVDHMRATSLPKGGGRIVITSEHVEDVYAKRAVRDRIRDRFRWTIGLDNRYRVIALVTALMAFDAAPGEGFSPGDLQDACASFWRAGFERTTLSSSEFRRYLEEMKGLGVLHCQDDGDYVLRSPNIRSLLGTKQQIEDELIEASETLEVEYRYNPTMNRRILERMDGSEGVEVRSPLSDADLAKLLDHKDPIQLVVGTQALGLARVAKALKKVASERKVNVVEVPVDKVAARARPDYDRHLIVDLTRRDLKKEVIEAAIHKLARTQGVFATVVLRADGPFDVTTVIDRFSHVSLNRWTADGLGAWQDSHFPTPSLRKDLKRSTGGWPEKVELAMRLVAGGKSPDESLREVVETVRTPEGGQSFLASAGVPVVDVVTWVKWFGETGKDGLLEVPALTLDWLDDTEEFTAPAAEVVSRLQLADAVDETSEGFVLDRLVVEAAQQLVP